MARKEISISQYLDLHWTDGRFTESDEQFFIEDAKSGYEEFCERCKARGHHKLLFNPEELIC